MDTLGRHERPEDRVRAPSRPSQLTITDLRTATVGWDRWHFTLVRIDTNQGLSGYGGVHLRQLLLRRVPA